MNDKVDIAELEKQYAELGEMIEKLGGTFEVKKANAEDDDDEVVKSKDKGDGVAKAKKKAKPVADAEDAADNGDDEAAELGKAAKAKADAVKKAKAKAEAEDVEKAAVDDEEIVFKGQAIKKSVVGEVQFGIAKSMSEEIEKNSKDIAKAKDDATLAKLEKRADDEFAHVPGTTAERAAMLKVVLEMPEPVRKSFEAVFKQSEALAKSAFEVKGSGGGDSADIKKVRTDFESKVAEVKKRDNCTRPEAMSKARIENPDLFKAYQDSQN